MATTSYSRKLGWVGGRRVWTSFHETASPTSTLLSWANPRTWIGGSGAAGGAVCDNVLMAASSMSIVAAAGISSRIEAGIDILRAATPLDLNAVVPGIWEAGWQIGISLFQFGNVDSIAQVLQDPAVSTIVAVVRPPPHHYLSR